MEKTIKIDSNTSLKVSNNIGWMLAYRDQFGRDIVPSLVPILSAAVDVIIEISKVAGDEGADVRQVLTAIDSATIRDAIVDMSGIEAVDIINIVWAMAKAADEDIDEPRIWVRQFEAFPVDVILPTIFDMVLKCMVSTKNYDRFQTAMEALGPSTSTPSS